MRLRIVSFNDVYSLENLPRMASLVAREKADGTRTVVTLPGDFLAPSILSSLDAGRGMVECLNAVGVELVTFGNHEDDVATDELRARMGELHATWLATNVREWGLPASKVIDVGGAKVGFLGVVMRDPAVYRRAPFGGAPIDEPIAAATREADRLLAEEGCACVIPLTHQFIEEDRALARAQARRPFPVILGGHEHEPFREEVAGTWIVKAGMEATHAVVVELDLATLHVDVRLEAVQSLPEDPAVRAIVDRHMARVHELEKATLVKLGPGEELSSVGTRSRQTSLGALLCSYVRDALGAEACLFNGGGIRASRTYAERFTYGDLKAEVPFDNEIVVATLPGSVVRDAVRASRRHAPAESGGFLQLDDRATAEGGELTHLAGRALDPSRAYRVALVRNMLLGLDDNTALVAFAKDSPASVPPAGSGRDVKIVLVDAFARALWKHLGGFDAVDANHDGAVTPSEILGAITRVTAEPASPITAGLVLHALDANEDHVLSRDESDD